MLAKLDKRDPYDVDISLEDVINRLEKFKNYARAITVKGGDKITRSIFSVFMLRLLSGHIKKVKELSLDEKETRKLRE
jgi:hypothetical protein